VEAGSPTAYQKANRIWKERLAAYEKPRMDPAAEEAVNDFVDRRIREGGVKTDF
jgi:trimethylamine---corrinoid protein Co-methyltransferase